MLCLSLPYSPTKPSTCRTHTPGLAWRKSAMQPATSGDAMDVPLSMWYDPKGTGYVLTCRSKLCQTILYAVAQSM